MAEVRPPRAGLAGLLRLALRLLGRDARSGELRIMAISLVVAVASFTTVAFFADRVKLALAQEASQLLGADLVLASDRPIPDHFREAAQRAGLVRTETTRFPSMVSSGEASVLTEIKAVEAGYPLKGRLTIADAAGRRAPGGPPNRGEVWIDDRLAERLKVAPGAMLAVGEAKFTVVARVVDDPEASIGFLNMMPRIVLNAADLPSTALVQTGSRVTYRLMLSGGQSALAGFRADAVPRLDRGQRVEDVRDARPEIRSALERAEKFLGLASLLSVILSAVAVALAARQYARRHVDHCAVLRCLGASRRVTVGLHAVQLGRPRARGQGWSGVSPGSSAQSGLAALLAPLVQVPLPPPGWRPAVEGVVAGFVLLLGFALPPLLSLGRVSALRVLRRDLAAPSLPAGLAHGAGIAAVAGFVLWHTRDARMAAWVLGGIAAAGVVSALVAWAMIRGVARLGSRAGFAWRFGLANLSRRAGASVIQVVALGAGLLALILLSITRGDLLESWRGSLPLDAPNRFLVNIQPDQVEPLKAFFAESGRDGTPVLPDGPRAARRDQRPSGELLPATRTIVRGGSWTGNSICRGPSARRTTT